MTESLKTLLSNVIDYAGLYPPAKLDMQEAVRTYKWLRSDDASNWMLGRFVCPAARLAEMDAQAGDDTFSLCVIGSGSLDADLDHIRSLRRGRVETYETRYSEGLDIAATRGGLSGGQLFIEVVPDELMAERVGELSSTGALAKIRTGGIDAAAFPSTSQVAHFICECAAKGMSFKATAGLHHPLYHHDDEFGVMMHGFLNVFLASALAAKGGATVEAIEVVLRIEDAGQFEFTDGHARVGDYLFSIEDLASGRRLALSYGSCSVNEPLEYLADLGLIGAKAV